MPPPQNEAHPVLDCLSGEHNHRVKEWRINFLWNEHDKRAYLRSADRERPDLDPALARDAQMYAHFLNGIEGRRDSYVADWREELAWLHLRGQEDWKPSHHPRYS